MLADFDDVFAAITVVRPTFAVWFNALRTQLYRARQIVDLVARVVVIELAMNRATLRFKQIAQRVAERSLSRVARMQRARWVRGDEFDEDFFAFACVAKSKLFARF